MKKKYYQLIQNGTTADIYIYGDITSYPWDETDVSSYGLAKELESIEADTINVYVNSYGGEVAEGLAIYNALKRHKAKIITHDDGFACSIASVVFMAGDERIMSNASLLMVHNAWNYCAGNADELRKEADDLDIISQAAFNVYKQAINIDDAELQTLLDAESWLLPEQCLTMGFATSIINDSTSAVSQCAKNALIKSVLMKIDIATIRESAAKIEPIIEIELEPVQIEKPVEPETEPENKLLKFLQAYNG